MLIGIVGKPSSGKTTILNALCMTDAKMGDYPFTTIKPNRGVSFVQINCPCKGLDDDCQPKTGYCEKGTRFVPIEILDVAGLVPGASEGKGMGNQFLDDLRQADAFIHVIDSSGESDEEGNPAKEYDPSNDLIWLNAELTTWIGNTLFRDWDRLSRKLDADRSTIAEALLEKLSGLGADLEVVRKSLRLSNLAEKNPKDWNEEERLNLADKIRIILFPSVIAANKADRASATNNINNLKEHFPTENIVKTSGLAELTLRKADQSGLIKYTPGSVQIDFLNNTENPSKMMKVVMAIKEKLFDQQESTGIAKLLNLCVFDILKLIAVFPVEDSTHLTDHDGRILPDVFLVPLGTTAKQFAGKVHTDLQKTFINGILVSDSNKRISATHELQNLDIIKIIAAQK